ncbi:hypothetical protein ACF07Y_02775 [Streptomyces sp. NPDC016566]|uniref:hypothetical protein n=1 Tax=Streptomyces sp. NPDC016566 TaxID=3364967 RepID=UPI0036FACA26
MSPRTVAMSALGHRRLAALPVLAALLAGTALSGCDSPGRRSDSVVPTQAPAPSASPGTEDLAAALLTTAQLPAGYVKTVLRDDPPTRSDRPVCLNSINSLESARVSHPDAVEARVDFAMSQSGPFLRQVLRRLPGSGARQDLEQAARTLSGCPEFSIGWSDGSTGTEQVEPHGSAGIGDASWHATVTATTGTFTVQETLVLVAAGRTLLVLGDAGSPAAPERSRTLALARTALSRLPRRP